MLFRSVGVIIGAAFQGVVTSLTTNILSPLIGLFTGQNFDMWSVTILGVEITYGAFISSVVNFFVMVFVVFLLVKLMNAILSQHKKDEEEPAPAPKCPYCLNEVKSGATRCPFCTSPLDPEEADAEEEPQEA